MHVSPNNSVSSGHAKEVTPKATRSARDVSSIVTAIGAVLFGLLLGILAQKALTAEFLGAGTRLVDMCKENPKHDPEACGPILEVRAPVKQKTGRETGIKEKSAPFQLSEEEQ
jgi:hypothetical protein